MGAPAAADESRSSLPPLTGYDDHDDPTAVEAFRMELRLLRLTARTGTLHSEVRVERGFRRHMDMKFVQRVEGSATRRQDNGPPPGMGERRRR